MTDTWTFQGADEKGIYVRLHRDGEQVDVILPQSQDYFEDGGKKSKYLDENFEQLWEDNQSISALKKRIDELEANLVVTDIAADDLKAILISKDLIKELDLEAVKEVK
jgi:hypothetical protein